MAERKLNPLWVGCKRIVTTVEKIDKYINQACKRYYDNENKPEYKELIETLKPQVHDFRSWAYDNCLKYHMYTSDEETSQYWDDLDKVVNAIKNHSSYPEDVDNTMLKEFYEKLITLDTTLNICLPE